MKKLCVWAVAALLMAACTPKAEKTTDSGLLQSNFQMEVDGKKTDIKQANTMYMALNLAEGEHEIRLTYHTPYLYTGLCLTCAGLLCYIGVVLICKKKRGNKKG